MYYYYYENDKVVKINVSKYMWHNIKVNKNLMWLSTIWGCLAPLKLRQSLFSVLVLLNIVKLMSSVTCIRVRVFSCNIVAKPLQ